MIERKGPVPKCTRPAATSPPRIEYWNYRIVEESTPDGDTWRAIHEVFYDEHDRPISVTVNPVGVYWYVEEGDQGGLGTLDKMREAFDKPILKATDFER